MGLAFLCKTNKQIRKRWDVQRTRLSAPDLFSGLAKSVRTIVVVPCNGFEFSEGQRFELDVQEGGRFYAYHDRLLVGICDQPARSLLLAAKEVGGKVLGVFHEVREHSGVVEIIVCVDSESAEPSDGASAKDHEERYRTKSTP